MGEILAKDHNAPSEALPYVRRAYELLISIGRVDRIVVVGFDYARILPAVGNRDAALNIARQIRTVAEGVGDDGFLSMTAMLLEELDAAP